MALTFSFGFNKYTQKYRANVLHFTNITHRYTVLLNWLKCSKFSMKSLDKIWKITESENALCGRKYESLVRLWLSFNHMESVLSQTQDQPRSTHGTEGENRHCSNTDKPISYTLLDYLSIWLTVCKNIIKCVIYCFYTFSQLQHEPYTSTHISLKGSEEWEVSGHLLFGNVKYIFFL